MRFRVDAILFDIDGTLVDSTAAVVRTWTTWAAMHGIDADEVLRVCHGRRTEDTLGMFLPAGQLATATAEIEQWDLADLDDVRALPERRAFASSSRRSLGGRDLGLAGTDASPPHGGRPAHP